MWLLPGSRCGLHATYGAPLTFPTAGPTKKRTTATSDGTMFPTIVPRCLCLRRCWLRRQRACRPRAMCHLLADLYLSARFDDRSTRPFRELLCFSCEAAYCCCFDVMVDDNQTGHAIVRAWLEGIRSIHPPPFKKATVFSRRSSSRTSALLDNNAPMSSLRNAVKRVEHKERAQPASRRKLGLLEKHKDYGERALTASSSCGRSRLSGCHSCSGSNQQPAHEWGSHLLCG